MDVTTEANNKGLADFIKARRTARGLSYAHLARMSGLHHSYWSKLESGQIQTPAPKYLRIIAETLDVSVIDLYALTDHTIPDDLPEFQPYMRAKYDLPPEAIAQLEGYFKFLRDYFGIPTDQPVFPPKSKAPKSDTPESGRDDRRAA